MTRTEFDRTFAARMDNTDGFTQAQLDVLNDLTFEAVQDRDIDDRATGDFVASAMEFASRHFDVRNA